MIQLTDHGMYLVNGVPQETAATDREEARRRTMAWQILQAHNESPDPMQLRIRFDAMVSHDITYVGIIQQARASGMKEFPIPYALTNCHNSLCAVGGTINEDDHRFGLSAAKKYGGIFVPPHMAVIHQYMREKFAGCGKMILGSDSHTRYGALGTMAIGEGGGELIAGAAVQIAFNFGNAIGSIVGGAALTATAMNYHYTGLAGAPIALIAVIMLVTYSRRYETHTGATERMREVHV